ncbi:hypothetical protein E2C01_037304 [Portunus trituberculatus]|uniref:Uncharacterized protein n=1 Tax=Portunus trituberculatus TaxID=210409 RepID=A0A5B7F903_PORTR|nr:hypothetical protein [Portunus trituberculatus]
MPHAALRKAMNVLFTSSSAVPLRPLAFLPAILHSSTRRSPPAPTSLIVLLPSHFSGMAESNGNRLSFQRSFGFHGSTSSPKDGAHLLQAPVSPLSVWLGLLVVGAVGDSDARLLPCTPPERNSKVGSLSIVVALWHQQQHHRRGLSVVLRGGLNLASPGPALCTQQYGSCVRDGPKWGRAEGSPASASLLGHSVKIHLQILRVRLSTSTATCAGYAAGRVCWLFDLPCRTCSSGGRWTSCSFLGHRDLEKRSGAHATREFSVCVWVWVWVWVWVGGGEIKGGYKYGDCCICPFLLHSSTDPSVVSRT